VPLICPLSNEPCGIGGNEGFACTKQCVCPCLPVKNLRLVYCPFDGSLCNELVIDHSDGSVSSYCRDKEEGWNYACSRFDGRFSRLIRRMGFEIFDVFGSR